MADIRRLSLSIPASPGLGQRDPDQVSIPAIPNSPNRRAWHATTGEGAAQYWVTNLDTGLDALEAEKRLLRLGPNKLSEKPGPTFLSRIVAQVSDFTVLALLGAAAIAAVIALVAPEPGVGFLGRFGDSMAILLIVILNAVLGLVQEKRPKRRSPRCAT